MQKKQLLGFALPVVFLTGCSGDYDYLVGQNKQLSEKINTIQQQVSKMQAEIGILKERKFVKLPTGAPTVPERRDSGSSNSSLGTPVTAPTQTATNNSEATLFNEALAAYKSGDVGEAIAQFEGFNARYPNSERRADVLYYMGEAYYSQRQFSRSQELLEALVYQYPQSKVHPQAVPQLKRIYQTTGKSTKMAELDDFLSRTNQSTPSTTDSGNETGLGTGSSAPAYININ